ncbi:MAG: bactofilin family protein [Patescibacteria group bacterium]
MGGKEKNGKGMDTIIGSDTSMRGTLDAEGVVRIDGRFEGDITTAADLYIGESGHVQGTIVARNITVAGHLQGKVEARGRLELLPSANVQGEIRMTLLVVEEGAYLQGNCEALPRGDLKERGKALKVETPPPAKS